MSGRTGVYRRVSARGRSVHVRFDRRDVPVAGKRPKKHFSKRCPRFRTGALSEHESELADKPTNVMTGERLPQPHVLRKHSRRDRHSSARDTMRVPRSALSAQITDPTCP